MKRIVINILMTTLILCSSLNTWAYDFEAEGVYYNISSPTELTVEVTSGENAYRGEINLTHSVLFNGTTYQVTSIGERAFSNCDALTAITLPQNLKSIGKYAFNHCTSLYSIITRNSYQHKRRRFLSMLESLIYTYTFVCHFYRNFSFSRMPHTSTNNCCIGKYPIRLIRWGII